jgi:fatty acid desaturase
MDRKMKPSPGQFSTGRGPFQRDLKINWYKSPIEAQVLKQLMRTSDIEGFKQAGGHLLLWIITGSLSFFLFTTLHQDNWFYGLPLLLVALFAHGTVGSFFAGTAVHELSHKTVFKTKWINELFLHLYGFLAWADPLHFRPSHIKHHQVTVHLHHDGEVELPMTLPVFNWQFWLGSLAWNPKSSWWRLRQLWRRASGRLDNDWMENVIPENNPVARRQHQNWARRTLVGHLVLAVVFIATGHWFLIFIFNLGTHYCGWLSFLCGFTQHYGMTPNVPDHRLSCRTMLLSPVPAFLYWNMQYHVEHHMFPAVPFYQLPKLRQAIAFDLPPATVGLVETWKEILRHHRQTVIPLPSSLTSN